MNFPLLLTVLCTEPLRQASFPKCVKLCGSWGLPTPPPTCTSTGLGQTHSQADTARPGGRSRSSLLAAGGKEEAILSPFQ